MSNNNLFTKSYDAAGPINPQSIVKIGAADYAVLQAGAATDAILGISTEISSNAGERTDVVLQGIADLKLGGTVTRGALLTSDASGNGVAAAPAAGVNNRVVGVAIIAGVAGDIIPCFISQGSMQG